MTVISLLRNFLVNRNHKIFLTYLNKYERQPLTSPLTFYLAGIKKKLFLLLSFQLILLIISPMLTLSYTTTIIIGILIFLGFLYNRYLSLSRLYLNRKLLYSLYSVVLFEDFLFFLTLERSLYNAIANIVRMQIHPISNAFYVILENAILLKSIDKELIEFAKYVPSENFKNVLFSILALSKSPLEIENLEYYLEFRKENLLFYTKITLSYGFLFFMLIFLTLFVSLINPFSIIVCVLYFLSVTLLEAFMERQVVLKNVTSR